MRTVCKTIYKFEELSDAAKEKARDWWRQHIFTDSNDWDHIYEDADTVASLMGIEIDRKEYKTMGGSTGTEPAIYFSGFSSQGDGACFEGRYRYKKGAPLAISREYPEDKELLRIARELVKVQSQYFYKLEATIKHSGNYYHARMMDVEVTREGDYIAGPQKDIRELMIDFGDWIYKQLRDEYHYLSEDDQVDETIISNEYEFNEDGSKS